VKTVTWSVGIAILAFSANPAMAGESEEDWSYDIKIEPVGCDCDSYCGDSCCGDSVGCGDVCNQCGRGGLCGAIEGFSLASLLGMEDSGIDIGGWSQWGYHDRATPLSPNYGDGLSFNDVPHQLNAQQQWIYLGKEADGSNGWDWGFRFDGMYGTDAQKTQAFGNPGSQWDNSWDNGVYGWAVPQAYAEVAVGDFSVKAGHFFTLIGYEVVPATGNFFYSHALTMFNSEPFTHTGVLTTYKGIDGVTLYNGWTAGWDTGFTNANGGSNYLGGVGLDLLDSLTVTYILTYGNFGLRDGGADDSYSHSVVFDFSLSDNLKYIFQTDLMSADDIPDDPGTPARDESVSNDQLSINQYLIYKWNDLLSFGGRVEWWKDSGTSHYEATGGVNVHVLNNLIFRPEIRKDWSPGLDTEQTTAACDAILTF
jgi:hypothetical protein